MQKTTWDEFWSTSMVSTYVNSFQILRNTTYLARWRKMEARIKKHFGFFKGLKTIELGSGRGVESLLMALRGASVTLVDFSEHALNNAKELFRSFGLSPNCLKANIFDIERDLFQEFDISMSFGTVEHFLTDSERRQAIDVHYKVLKPGGVTFISVPNKMCPHHRFLLQLGKMVGLGLEQKPFVPFELVRYAREVGFTHYEVFGSSLFDFSYSHELTNLLYRFAQIGTRFDKYLAYALILFAVK